ncbi:hypothetical protein C900_02124 [Fulvivirga imtechensis AK7]|uniref:Outer membrane protein beta-barrel domain-containing protein n=1 Tax=Fulvivirga imtechensis AK7 TaxID=1237149 RepID=L8JWE2_9BACT|nr:hypothetical protein [Fulvivirga imtechensis]ELR71939.1 hypothetical protein C900_02124 [Fulvivirga imtechensis AK7]
MIVRRAKWSRTIIHQCKKTKILFAISLILLPLTLFSQNFEVKLSDKQIQKVEKARDARTKLKRYKKYYSKDSLKQAKAARKYWRYKSDSLVKANRLADELPGGQHIDALKGVSPDSSQVDSLQAIAQQKVEQELKAATGAAEVERMAGQKIGDLDNPDSLKSAAGHVAQEEAKQYGSKLEGMEELQAFQEERNALKEWQDAPDTYKNDVEKYSDVEEMRNTGREMAKEKAAEFFAAHSEKLQAAQKKLQRLQKKYIKLPNSNDMSTAVKRSSLKGRPLKERLYLGGNFIVNSIKPFSIDLTPQVGYKFNKKFIVGVGGTIRHTFGSDTIASVPAIPSNSYGYKGFTSYDIAMGFFAYGEFERLSKKVAIAGSDQQETIWVNGLLAGAGKKFNVHALVNVNVLVLYNFLHDYQNAIYPRAWTLKFGFELSERAFLRRR